MKSLMYIAGWTACSAAELQQKQIARAVLIGGIAITIIGAIIAVQKVSQSSMAPRNKRLVHYIVIPLNAVFWCAIFAGIAFFMSPWCI